MNATQELYGCDELREWLAAQGFHITYDGMNTGNECNWCACRRIALPARECECNTGKTMQIVVHPWRYVHRDAHGLAWEHATVDITGEAGGTWFKLQAYSLKHNELRERLGEIETSLISAWNALRP